MNKSVKEVRLAEVKTSNDEEMLVEGYAVVYDSITDLGWSKEVIDRNAFNNCDMTDVCMKYNHLDNVLVMARTRNHSLELINDDHGLKIRAKLINTQNNKDIFKSIKAGLLDKMSFSFVVNKEDIDYSTDTRRILEIGKLFDVSVVDVPAYESTEIYARNKEQFQKEKEEYNKNKLELEKEKLKLKLSL